MRSDLFQLIYFLPVGFIDITISELLMNEVNHNEIVCPNMRKPIEILLSVTVWQTVIKVPIVAVTIPTYT